MTTKVTKESLAEKIKYLESVSKLGLSLNEEYQLKAYRLLIDLMPDGKHEHNWLDVTLFGLGTDKQVCECGATRAPGEDDQHAHMVD